MASYNIFVGIYVATIFGSAFFFDLFWPERQESKGVKLAWRICSILACVFTFSVALGFTILVATKSAYVSGADAATASRYLAEYGGSPMRYRDNGRAIASVVFIWPGMIATIARYAFQSLVAHYPNTPTAPSFYGNPCPILIPTVRNPLTPGCVMM